MHDQPGSQSKIERLEESLAFTERTVEVLSGEIAELNRIISALTSRVARLEARIETLELGDEDAEQDDDA